MTEDASDEDPPSGDGSDRGRDGADDGSDRGGDGTDRESEPDGSRPESGRDRFGLRDAADESAGVDGPFADEPPGTDAADVTDASNVTDGPNAEDGTDDGAPPEGSNDAPLADLARELSERRSRREEADDLFEEVDVGDVESERVWEMLSDVDGEDEGVADVGVGASATRVDGDRGGRTGGGEYVVPKDAFCQRCPYLTAPPEVACEHDGTRIVEMVDSEQFRVSGCPFVEDENLADDLGSDFA
ncbi:MAG: hypothetical protein ABEJ28_03750 [Salinigranum sp.]